MGVGIQQPQPFDVGFPLRLGDFRTENGYRVLDFQAEGVWFSAAIRTPPNVSVADLNAAAAVVSSIRFPQLHEGTPASNGYFVAGRASSYRPGSVFTGTVTTATCASIAATATIVCTNGALSDIDGRIVRNPDPARYQHEPLPRVTAPVS